MTLRCTPAPQDCSGWYRSDVAIDRTVIPSDAAVTGCQDKPFTTDTPGTNEFCSADDGSATVTVQPKIKVDKTPPVVTGGQPTRSTDVNGWYNHAVAVAFAGSDLTSGIATCTVTTYAKHTPRCRLVATFVATSRSSDASVSSAKRDDSDDLAPPGQI